MAGPLQHPVLGPLDWDEQLAWWIAKVELKPDHPIELFISGEGDLPEAILTQVPLWLERIRSEEPDYRRWTAEQCVSGQSDSEEALTVEEITELLQLASISFDSDGAASLCWDEQGRLYCEHSLVTDIDGAGKCTRVWSAG
jgi:hypothetical protein